MERADGLMRRLSHVLDNGSAHFDMPVFGKSIEVTLKQEQVLNISREVLARPDILGKIRRSR
jgi:hypothetical protein